jgi:hypothetical protein
MGDDTEHPSEYWNEDKILWRWTSDGDYTTKSVYKIQFMGDYNKLKMNPIWKSKAEPKCRFFADWYMAKFYGGKSTKERLEKWSNL